MEKWSFLFCLQEPVQSLRRSFRFAVEQRRKHLVIAELRCEAGLSVANAEVHARTFARFGRAKIR